MILAPRLLLSILFALEVATATMGTPTQGGGPAAASAPSPFSPEQQALLDSVVGPLTAQITDLKQKLGEAKERGYSVDMKFGKPPDLKQHGENWDEFSTKLKSHASLVQPCLGAQLEALEHPTADEVEMVDLTDREAANARSLYHALTMTVTGASLRLVKRVTDNNGFEAYRQLSQR